MTVWPNPTSRPPGTGLAVGLPAGGLGLARAKFLSAEPVESTEVRSAILASWRRSNDFRVDCDELSAPFEADLDVQGHLVQAAAPVLDQLSNRLNEQAVSIVLTNADGFVLDRRTGKRDLQDYLDSVYLAPGFNYAEQFVGTNGIGTALEAGEAALIYEQEHFTGPLVNLACAGVPIHDPITGSLEGVLDITCFARDASPLLMAMAISAAQGVQERLLDESRGQDIALLREYLRATRRSGDPIVAVNDDVVMLNPRAQTSLSAQDQVLLMDHLRTERPSARPAELDLPSGAKCRVHTKRVADRGFGAVARIQFVDPSPAGALEIQPPPVLPGVVGSAVMWRRCHRALDAHYRDGCWVVLEGESGSGKAAIAQAVHRYHNPDQQIRVVDALESSGPRSWVPDEVLGRPGAVLLQHLDRLSDAQLAELAELLESADKRRNWLAGTVDSTTTRSPLLDRVLAFFPRSVEVPPLRHHIEDVAEIADFLLQQATKRANSHFSPAALRVLMRAQWPGNIAELQRVVQSVAARTRSATVLPEDLPPECNSQSRRILTPIESMERDAIVRCLAEAGGNRTKAARSLGISRATIYRKITNYGIDT
ncbi:GAF domain-containing protein [Saccharopolyspora sp. K220]|uniref:sigma-54-dependent Fis family transcriptional regulator n=1 Tax=Saccharopolyspora soli TaxID=2926618 RepID=UPI001F58DB75|nr:helix-turn-helix domain-containing protein [Saccharopolyspora soli]MCI2422457.1 GAF domain-containing protein [Saccharopolyspora soli]